MNLPGQSKISSPPRIENEKTPISAVVVLLIGVLSVSAAALMIRKAQVDAPSLTIAAWRLTLATIILAPFSLTRIKFDLGRLSNRQHVLIILGGGFLAIHFISWITSLEYTSIASSVVLVTTAPLWVALLSPRILGERITWLVWLGLIIALIGGAMVGLSETCGIGPLGISCKKEIGPWMKGGQLGNFLAIVGAWCSAAYLMIGRKLRPHLNIRSYAVMVYGTAALFLLFACLLRGKAIAGFSPGTYFWMVGLAVVPQIIGHSSFNYALAFLPAALVSVALLGEPIGAVILGYVFLKEIPSTMELAGGGLVLLGLYLANKGPQKVS